MSQGKRSLRPSDIVTANFSKVGECHDVITKGKQYIVIRVNRNHRGRIRLAGQTGYWKSSHFTRKRRIEDAPTSNSHSTNLADISISYNDR